MGRAVPTQTSIDFTVGMDARDVGIERAVNHADRVESQWSGMALGQLLAFLRTVDGPFLMEEARAWAEAHDLPPPPDARAWGGVTLRAKGKGYIRRAGFGIGAVNASPKPMWVRNVDKLPA